MTQSIESVNKSSKRARLSLILSALFASVSLSGTGSAWAEVPQVAVSIKPVHSLVSAVMEGVGTPQLIVKGTGSEHNYALRPEDARILAGADIVFWVGPGMETFLQRPLDNLAQNAQKIELSEAPGIEHVAMREGGTFEAHTHDHGHDHEHKHEKADGLSRRQCEMDGCSYCTKMEEKQANHQGKCIARMTMEVVNLEDWRKEQLADPSVALILCTKEKEERSARTEVVNKDIFVRIY